MKNGHPAKPPLRTRAKAKRVPHSEPPPSAEEIARMRVPAHPLGEEARWICKIKVTRHPTFKEAKRDVFEYFRMKDIVEWRTCAVRAQSAFAARQLAAQRLGCEPGEIVVGVVP